MGLFNKTAIKKKYEFGETLGSGNFAVVKKGTVKSGHQLEGGPTTVAIKVIDKAKVEDMNDIQREIEIMGMMDHPHVVKLYEIYDEAKKMNLIMELVTGGEVWLANRLWPHMQTAAHASRAEASQNGVCGSTQHGMCCLPQ